MKQRKVIIEVSRKEDGELFFEIHPKGQKGPVRTWTKYRSAAMHDAMCMWANLNCAQGESAGSALLRLRGAA